MKTPATNKLKFSKQRLEALPASSGKVSYYYDTESKGLAMSVGTTGRKTFLLYRKVRGVPRRIGLGPFPDLTVEQARAQAAQLNGSIAAGEVPSKAKTRLTFAEAFQDYLEKHSKPTKRTSSEDAAIYERNLTGKRGWPSLAERDLYEIEGSLLRTIHRAMVGTPVAANQRVLARDSGGLLRQTQSSTHCPQVLRTQSRKVFAERRNAMAP
jgi:Arm DNA-binding domain